MGMHYPKRFSRKTRKRRHGLRNRMKTKNGRKMINRKRAAGRGPDLTRPSAKIGRNDPCPCGSGKKYKHCCLNR